MSDRTSPRPRPSCVGPRGGALPDLAPLRGALWWAALLSVAAAGCDDASPADASPPDASPPDAEAPDAPPPDASPPGAEALRDGSVADGLLADGSTPEAGPADGSGPDVWSGGAPLDAARSDAAPDGAAPDAAPPDAAPRFPDAGPRDAAGGEPDAGAPDTQVDLDARAPDAAQAAPDAAPAPVPFAGRPPRGYLRRPCGFDLDADGVVGEPEECRFCDGDPQTGAFTADPDGDGVDEDFLYVHATEGSDEEGDGTPQRPYRTIQHAWSVADGPEDGAEDIVCFAGVATTEENIVPGVSGVPGVRVQPRRGSEARDWELPAHPTMLVGWDRDGDGQYPPFDPDDEAVLDGGPSALDRTFTLNLSDRPAVRYLEIAHLTVRAYGFTTENDGDDGQAEGIGFLHVGRSNAEGPQTTHIHLHDLELESVMQDKPAEGHAIVFDLFTGGTRVRHLSVVNVSARDTGSYFARGAPGGVEGDESGPLRFQNVTLTQHGCDAGSAPDCPLTGPASAAVGFKVWGLLRGVEVIDSVFDANIEGWEPRASGPTSGIIVDGCVVDWLIRNNTVRNYHTALMVKGSGNSGVVDGAGGCVSRPVDDVLIDANTVLTDTEFYTEVDVAPEPGRQRRFGFGVAGLLMNDTERATVGGSIANVTVTNNFFLAPYGFAQCVGLNVSNNEAPAPGTFRFTHNTCHGGTTFRSNGILNLLPGTGAFPFPDVVVTNNLFSGLEFSDEAPLAIVAAYRPTALDLRNNAYSVNASFIWLDGEPVNLAGWQAALPEGTGRDGDAQLCLPDFVDAAGFDFHLRDTPNNRACVIAQGLLGPEGAVDVDGEPRGAPPEIGADEIDESPAPPAADAGPPPPDGGDADAAVPPGLPHPRAFEPGFYVESVTQFDNPWDPAECTGPDQPIWGCLGPGVGRLVDPIDSFVVDTLHDPQHRLRGRRRSPRLLCGCLARRGQHVLLRGAGAQPPRPGPDLLSAPRVPRRLRRAVEGPDSGQEPQQLPPALGVDLRAGRPGDPLLRGRLSQWPPVRTWPRPVGRARLSR